MGYWNECPFSGVFGGTKAYQILTFFDKNTQRTCTKAPDKGRKRGFFRSDLLKRVKSGGSCQAVIGGGGRVQTGFLVDQGRKGRQNVAPLVKRRMSGWCGSDPQVFPGPSRAKAWDWSPPVRSSAMPEIGGDQGWPYIIHRDCSGLCAWMVSDGLKPPLLSCLTIAIEKRQNKQNTLLVGVL